MNKILGLSFVLLLIASCTGSYYGVAEEEDKSSNPQVTSCSGMDCNMGYCDALKVNQKEGCQLRTNLAFIEICPSIMKNMKKETSTTESAISSMAVLEKARINTETIEEKPIEQELCKVFDVFNNIDCKIAGTETIQTNDFLSALLLCAKTTSSCKLDIDLEGLSELYADCKSGKITTFTISCEEEKQCQEPFVYNEKTKTCDCPAPFVYSLKTGICACPAGTSLNIRTNTCDPVIVVDPCSGKCRADEICVISQAAASTTVSCQKIPCKIDTDCPKEAVCGPSGLCIKNQQVLQLLE